MTREEKIISISKKIQKEIDKLKLLNCSVSARYENICVFDNTITPEKSGTIEPDIDFGNQVAFSFNCDHHSKKK